MERVASVVGGREAVRPGRSERGRRGWRRRRRWGVGLAALAVVPITVGCEPMPCEPPFLPVQQVDLGATTPPPLPWPVEGVVRPTPLRAFDTDADGVEDTVTPDGWTPSPTITIGRASGDLVLTGDPAVIPGLTYEYAPTLVSPGDVDGDGRSDLVVKTLDERGFATAAYLVPGSTPSGTHHPADVGVDLFGEGVPRTLYAVGDYDEDGADDLGFDGGDGRTYLLAGPDVAAPGPGGTLPVGSLQPIAELPGRPVGVLRLMPDVAAVAMEPGGPEIVLWARGGALGFSLGFDQWSYPPGIEVAVADGPGGERWLVAEVWQRYRGVRYVWDLDHPCGDRSPPMS